MEIVTSETEKGQCPAVDASWDENLRRQRSDCVILGILQRLNLYVITSFNVHRD